MIKVLVVDDNDFSVDIISNAIARDDVEVIKAVDGSEAIRIFEESQINEIEVILMDIIMANMKGNIAAKTIREMRRADALTVRIYATTALKSFKEEYEDWGFNGVIIKPYTRESLQALVDWKG